VHQALDSLVVYDSAMCFQFQENSSHTVSPIVPVEDLSYIFPDPITTVSFFVPPPLIVENGTSHLPAIQHDCKPVLQP